MDWTPEEPIPIKVEPWPSIYPTFNPPADYSDYDDTGIDPNDTKLL